MGKFVILIVLLIGQAIEYFSDTFVGPGPCKIISDNIL